MAALPSKLHAPAAPLPACVTQKVCLVALWRSRGAAQPTEIWPREPAPGRSQQSLTPFASALWNLWWHGREHLLPLDPRRPTDYEHALKRQRRLSQLPLWQTSWALPSRAGSRHHWQCAAQRGKLGVAWLGHPANLNKKEELLWPETKMRCQWAGAWSEAQEYSVLPKYCLLT